MNWRQGLLRSWITATAAWVAGAGVHHWYRYCHPKPFDRFDAVPLAPWAKAKTLDFSGVHVSYCSDTSPYILAGPPLAALLIGLAIL